MERGLEDVLILIEGVHQRIPDAPSGMQPIYIASPPPGSESKPAAGPAPSPAAAPPVAPPAAPAKAGAGGEGPPARSTPPPAGAPAKNPPDAVRRLNQAAGPSAGGQVRRLPTRASGS